MPSFYDLPLLPPLQSTLSEQSITVPTEIQSQTLPALLEGKSLVGVSETGSGKTLAYVLPMLHQLKSLELEGSSVDTPGRPRGLVLVPGRELGEQVSKVFKTLTHAARVRVRVALGGSAKKVARRAVAGNFEILVATPGRLVQLMDGGLLKLDDARMIVFDEADQILDPGFLPVVRRILKAAPHDVQLVMFSATLPQSLETVVGEVYATPPVRVRTSGSQRVVPTLTTDNRQVGAKTRFDVLRTVLAKGPKRTSLLFANTREQCDAIAAFLETEGVAYVAYRGEMDRLERRANLARFRKGDVSVLIATDLGGRGLDIERIERVINVHLPQDIHNYLHRVGRTARAGRSGLVVNLVTPRDKPLMTKLQKHEDTRR
jgi:ATP-dependent RNA helicase RhlE